MADEEKHGEQQQGEGPQGGSRQQGEGSEGAQGAQGQQQGGESGSEEGEQIKRLEAALNAERKERAQTRKELDELKRSAMSESEQAIAAARDEGKAAALKELGGQLAEARFRTAAAGKVTADAVDAVAAVADWSRFVNDDGTVDENKVQERVAALESSIGQGQKGTSTARKGVGNGAVEESNDFFGSVMRGTPV